VQTLSAFSVFPLMYAFGKLGPFSLQYWRATKAGLKMASILVRLGVARSCCELHDICGIDAEYSCVHIIQFQVASSIREHFEQIRTEVDRCLPRQSRMYRAICAANVVKDMAIPLCYLDLLYNTARRLAKGTGILEEKVAVISPYKRLRRRIVGRAKISPILLIHQPSLVGAPLFVLAACVLLAVRDAFTVRRRRLPVAPRCGGIGVTAAWGLEPGRLNDFFWWWQTRITADRLLYLFDRSDVQPTSVMLAKARNLGIESVALNKQAYGEGAHLLVEGRKDLSACVGDIWFAARIAFRSLFTNAFGQLIHSNILKHYMQASKLTAVYHELGLRAVFSHEEQTDIAALAAEQADGIRVGFHWSSWEVPDSAAIRPHHVFFLWGQHDARIFLDAGSVSQHLLVSGCPMQEMRSNARDHRAAFNVAQEVRRQGAGYILALFDSSVPSPRFYQFFLQWLLDDQTLGILIKPKYLQRWEELQVNGLRRVVKEAMATGRLHVLDSSASPAYAALAADFAVGVVTPSALVISALAGARVLYLDYVKVDQGLLKPYATLHSLGPKRCVFHDPQSLKRAVQEYAQNPGANPYLGDASPVLHHFDPFRDGKASQRIGEYVGWYLESLDAGMHRDQALAQATRRYAEKWGANAVLRGLSPASAVVTMAAMGGDRAVAAQRGREGV